MTQDDSVLEAWCWAAGTARMEGNEDSMIFKYKEKERDRAR